MKIIQYHLTKNDCYNDGRMINPIGAMIHSVGTPQPDPFVFMNNWNRSRVAKCVTGFIDAKGNVYVNLPLRKRAWHGGGSVNSTHLGFEMTEPSTIKYTGGSSWVDLDPVKTKAHVMSTYKTAVEYFAHLCVLFGWDPLKSGVIISHAEGYARGIASNHGDPEHIWKRFGLSTAGFRKDIKAAMNKDKGYFALGDTGDGVRKLQTDMARIGFSTPGGIDGSYGPGTQASVKSFQINYGLTVDGIAGPQTLSKINQLVTQRIALEKAQKAAEAEEAARKAAEAEALKDKVIAPDGKYYRVVSQFGVFKVKEGADETKKAVEELLKAKGIKVNDQDPIVKVILE